MNTSVCDPGLASLGRGREMREGAHCFRRRCAPPGHRHQRGKAHGEGEKGERRQVIPSPQVISRGDGQGGGWGRVLITTSGEKNASRTITGESYKYSV